MTVFKYRLEIAAQQTITVPEVFTPLTVEDQNGVPCLWALVDHRAKKVDRTVYIVGTGQEINFSTTDFHHVASFQMLGGALVWHVFM